MIKTVIIFLIVFCLSGLNISQATAGCNIVWSGSYSGSIPTNETSKTKQAAQELYNSLWYSPSGQECPNVNINPSFDDLGCYGYYEYIPIECWKWVCPGGDWNAGVYCALTPRCSYLNYNASGTWDVICDTTTTTQQSTSTTTTTISSWSCAVDFIYGENSEQTELLREYRDKVLSKTPEGQELIKTYYKFSPAVTKLLEQRPLLKNRAKAFIDSMLPEIREEITESSKGKP